MLPIRIVGVGREAVAVADEKPHAVGIAVPAHANSRPVLKRDLESHARLRNFEPHRGTPPADIFQPATRQHAKHSPDLWAPPVPRSTLDSRPK